MSRIGIRGYTVHADGVIYGTKCSEAMRKLGQELIRIADHVDLTPDKDINFESCFARGGLSVNELTPEPRH